MCSLSEITDLLSKIALNIKAIDQTDGNNELYMACDLSISKLNQSLNLSTNSRVLDTALSLMCFKAPQVFDSLIDCEVKTIVSFLSSSVVCKVLSFHKEEVLQIGSFIPRKACLELIETCADVWMKLEEVHIHGMLSRLLWYALVRVLAFASSYQHMFPSIPVPDHKPLIERSSTISKLLCRVPTEFSVMNHEIPSRLLLWYIDPLYLRQDITIMLNEALERPFLYLKMEFQERTYWRFLIICFALSPAIFIQTRALLHNWFLLTGLASVLEFQRELVWLILNVISQPSLWGLSMEVSSILPFSNAYFPYTYHLLRTLVAPISNQTFLELVDLLDRKSCLGDNEYFDLSLEESSMKIAKVDHKSFWSLAMNFPDWFSFASFLLFSDTKIEQNPNMCAIAAKYIAWILIPFSKSRRDIAFNYLTKISCSWMALKMRKFEEREARPRKKLKKLRLHGGEDEISYAKDKVLSWVQELENMNVFGLCESEAGHGSLFRIIPLGILMNSSHCIDKNGCDVLLHYASAGLMIGKQHSQRHDDSITMSNSETIAGACLVFNLIDIAETISESVAESEEAKLDFVCQVKERTRGYLLKCVMQLLEFEAIGILMLKDLRARLIRWRHQGREILDHMDCAIAALDHMISP